MTKWRFFSSKISRVERGIQLLFSTRIPVDYDGALNFYLSFLTRHIGYKVSFYNKVVVPFGYGNKRSLSVFPFKCVYSRFGFPWGTAWSYSIMLTKVRNDWYIILPIIKHIRNSLFSSRTRFSPCWRANKVFRYSIWETIPMFFNHLKSDFILVRSLQHLHQ